MNEDMIEDMKNLSAITGLARSEAFLKKRDKSKYDNIQINLKKIRVDREYTRPWGDQTHVYGKL